MAWTYSGNPNDNPRDQVRFLIGDTDEKDQLLRDEEIQYLLQQYNNGIFQTAIRCCETISAKFSRRVSEAVGQVRIEFQQAAKAYRDMVNDLRRRMAIEESTPTAGGIFVADKIANATNPAIVQPDFSKQMMDNNQIAPTTNIDNITASIANEQTP